jgi:transposase-like protein
VREIRRRTRRNFSPEEKIRIVLEAFEASRAFRNCAVVKASPRHLSQSEKCSYASPTYSFDLQKRVSCASVIGLARRFVSSAAQRVAWSVVLFET